MLCEHAMLECYSVSMPYTPYRLGAFHAVTKPYLNKCKQDNPQHR